MNRDKKFDCVQLRKFDGGASWEGIGCLRCIIRRSQKSKNGRTQPPFKFLLTLKLNVCHVPYHTGYPVALHMFDVCLEKKLKISHTYVVPGTHVLKKCMHNLCIKNKIIHVPHHDECGHTCCISMHNNMRLLVYRRVPPPEGIYLHVMFPKVLLQRHSLSFQRR